LALTQKPKAQWHPKDDANPNERESDAKCNQANWPLPYELTKFTSVHHQSSDSSIEVGSTHQCRRGDQASTKAAINH
jgi:hypothetical protein